MQLDRGKPNEKFCILVQLPLVAACYWRWPAAYATTVANPICPANTAFFDPGNGENIVVPPGYSVSVFKAGLNFPTGIAFRETGQYGEVRGLCP